LEVTAATVAVNAALFAPAPIFTLAGTVMFALLLSSVTLAALEGAAVRLTVQVEIPGAFTVAGEQVKLLTCAAAARLIVVCLLWPLKVAVSTALWVLLTLPEVAVKLPAL